MILISLALIGVSAPGVPAAASVELETPAAVVRYEPAEFVLRVDPPAFGNPFVEAALDGEFVLAGGKPVRVRGFVDSQDGGVLRLRFCPGTPGVYQYQISLRGGKIDRRFEGEIRCEPSERPGPVVVDPHHPKHFIFAGSNKPYYPLGYTAYHFLDTSNDDAVIDGLIAYCVRERFNRIRFLLTGYPRDMDGRSSTDVEFGVPDPWAAPNYGSRPGQVNPLPAWPGKPHHYDFSRFNVAYWQRVDRAVRAMRKAGIQAVCIVTIEKQNLPKEYGVLSDAEYRLYGYAVARLAAFDNVWWDLGNEHNEYRSVEWGNTMGAFVKEQDPYGRPASAHAYADFLYPKSNWADFIITQQYGDEKTVHDWVLKYRELPKPYVDEEYGYEGEGTTYRKKEANAPGHGQSADWTRRSHWSIAMAGGYATYGDWSGGVSYFYMGEPGSGKAARQLKHLRAFFEGLPFNEMVSADERISGGFCLAKPPDRFVFYLPRGGTVEISLPKPPEKDWRAEWFDPRTGERTPGVAVREGKQQITSPAGGDWVLDVHP